MHGVHTVAPNPVGVLVPLAAVAIVGFSTHHGGTGSEVRDHDGNSRYCPDERHKTPSYILPDEQRPAIAAATPAKGNIVDELNGLDTGLKFGVNGAGFIAAPAGDLGKLGEGQRKALLGDAFLYNPRKNEIFLDPSREVTDADMALLRQNAAAIKAAAGDTSVAKPVPAVAGPAAVPAAAAVDDQSQNNGLPKGMTLDQFNEALKGTGLTFKIADDGVIAADAKGLANLSAEDRTKLLGPNFGFDPDRKEIFIDTDHRLTSKDIAFVQSNADKIKAALDTPEQAAQKDQGKQSSGAGASGPATTATPTGPDFTSPTFQDKVAEAQVMLETLHKKGVLKHSINTRGFGVDGLFGFDHGGLGGDTGKTLEEFKKLAGNTPPVNAQLDDETFHRLVQQFQKVEGLAPSSGRVDEATLHVILQEQQKLKDSGMKVGHAVEEGKLIAQNTPSVSGGKGGPALA